MIEIKHLKTLKALAQTGSLAKAAERLFTSQSALSHQLKELESRLNVSLFERKSSPIRFSPQGQLLLNLATELLPQVAKAEVQIMSKSSVSTSRRVLGIECHACFQWLLPTINHFNQSNSDTQLELLSDTLFEGRKALQQAKVDILFSDQAIVDKEVQHQIIGEFEVVLAMASHDPLAQHATVSALDLCSKRLLTYPLEPEKLDIFREVLQPANCWPDSIKQVDNSNTILQMVAAGMGVAALPDWLVARFSEQQLLRTKRIGEQGIRRKLYVCYRAECDELVGRLMPQLIDDFQRLSLG